MYITQTQQFHFLGLSYMWDYARAWYSLQHWLSQQNIKHKISISRRQVKYIIQHSYNEILFNYIKKNSETLKICVLKTRRNNNMYSYLFVFTWRSSGRIPKKLYNQLVTCRGWRTGMGEKLSTVYLFYFYIFELVNVYLPKTSLKKTNTFSFQSFV